MMYVLKHRLFKIFTRYRLDGAQNEYVNAGVNVATLSKDKRKKSKSRRVYANAK